MYKHFYISLLFFLIIFNLTIIGCKGKDQELMELSELNESALEGEEAIDPLNEEELSLTRTEKVLSDFDSIPGDKSLIYRISGSEGSVGENEGMGEISAEVKEEASKVTLKVYVCGEVNKTGVYELDEGSRVIDALKAAGGLTKEAVARGINMAAFLTDGAMIYIPNEEDVKNEVDITNDSSSWITEGNNSVKTGENTGMSTDSPKGTMVNINTASKEELMTLNGVGESKAEKIIAFREENGKFNAIEDIMNITGIKEGMFNKIKDSICVK
ncbi:MAG: ComEA family DNA-binding protein [Lachnospiraceae bacterium]|nr:ComEA family DNA-binding protein [Lachnospiraceae bacterium]